MLNGVIEKKFLKEIMKIKTRDGETEGGPVPSVKPYQRYTGLFLRRELINVKYLFTSYRKLDNYSRLTKLSGGELESVILLLTEQSYGFSC